MLTFIPIVHEYSSFGYSGDLVSFSHCVFVSDGREADAWSQHTTHGEQLTAAKLQSISKECLFLINVTDGMLGRLCLAIIGLRVLTKVADITAAMSVARA